jgi:hypothetical protein
VSWFHPKAAFAQFVSTQLLLRSCGKQAPEVRVGSNPEKLNASKCFPLFTQQRTFAQATRKKPPKGDLSI